MTELPLELDQGRYRLLERVGEGGYGEVFRGVQTSVDRVVAIKLVKSHLGDRPDVRERFRREATLTSRLDHPNAVRVIDFGEDDSGMFLVMEFVEGPTLKQLLRDHRALHPERVRRIARGVASALDAAHRIGLVHRDLKPGNVIIDARRGAERPVVIDFGLVKMFAAEDGDAALTRSNVMIGTPAYLSPEAVLAGATDGRSDLYSLGVMLFELLTGARPWSGESVVEVATARLHADPPALPAHVPHDLAALVRALLEREPARRPASAAAVLAALDGGAAWELESADHRGPLDLTAGSGSPEGRRPGLDDTGPLAADAHDTGPPGRPPAPAADLTLAPTRGPAAGSRSGGAATARSGPGVASPPEPPRTPAARPTRRPRLPGLALAIAGALVLGWGLWGAVGATLGARSADAPGRTGAAELGGAPTDRAPAPAAVAPDTDAAGGSPAVEGAGADLPMVGAQATGPSDSVDTQGTSPPGSLVAPAAPEPLVAGSPPTAAGGARTDEPLAPPPPAEAQGTPAASTAVGGRAPEPRRATQRTETRPGVGTLSVNAEPWAEVFVDGRRIGETPVRGLELDEGEYTVRTRYAGSEREQLVRIRRGESETITHRYNR